MLLTTKRSGIYRILGWRINLLELFPVLIMLVLFCIILTTIFYVNEGHFTYTLDDPYIHLELARNLTQGHYGINAEEFSAPSSSILWPFLLAIFALFNAELYAPLLINLIAAGLTISIIQTLIKEIIGHNHHLLSAVITVGLILSTNLIGLIFTGMEHSLQTLLAVSVLVGLIQWQMKGEITWWLLVALIAGPLIRYENLAITLPAIFILAYKKRYKETLLVALILTLTMLGFSLYLHALGLGWLPTSIQAKSLMVAHVPGIKGIFYNVLINLSWRAGITMLFLFVPLAAMFFGSKDSNQRTIAAFTSLAVLAHLIFGSFGWFFRYEIYMISTTLLALFYLYWDYLVPMIIKPTQKPKLLIFSTLVIVLFYPYASPIFTSHIAASNIYQQQNQLARFARGFVRGPVAVNDIGMVSYQNANYVLDLWGLASKEALDSRLNEEGSDWANQLIQKHNVKIAMIYSNIFKDLPQGWIPLGEMHINSKKISVAKSIVNFYATDINYESYGIGLLHDFKDSLPKGVSLIIY